MAAHTTPKAPKHLVQYRPDIDGLRAVAVLSVVGFHAFPTVITGGFIGVDIFFVISGFLISTIIYGSLHENSFSFGEFYARRINRIFPALLLVLIACYLFGWLTLFAVEYKQLGKHLAGGAGFISNILLWDESGYFDTTAEVKPLLHLWSLGIEEQFYIFWPVILWVVWKARINILTIATIAAALSLAWNVKDITSDAASVFYMPHTRAWELLAGAIIAYIQFQSKGSPAKTQNSVNTEQVARPATQRQQLLRNSSSIVGLFVLSYGFYAITSATPFPGWWAAIPTIGTVLVIAAGQKAWINRHVIAFRPFVWIGLISFPLYLWHWPLLSFARVIEGETPSLKIRIIAVVISVVLAWSTYLFIERPLRRINSKLKAPVLACVMLIVGSIGFTTYLYDGLPNRTASKSTEEFNGQFVGPFWGYAKNDICMNRYPFKEAESYVWWFCMANKDEAPRILLLGNSYANHLFPGLMNAEETRANSILSIGTCTFDIPDITDPDAATNGSPCSGNRSYHQRILINEIVEKSASLKFVIIDGLSPKSDKDAILRINERIGFLEKHGIQVIIFVPHITVPRDLKSCYSRPLKTKPADCSLGIEVKKQIDDAFAHVASQISASHPSVKFFDQNELFCDKNHCSLTLNGMPIYRDHFGHYSEYASKEVANLFIRWAKTNTPHILKL